MISLLLALAAQADEPAAPAHDLPGAFLRERRWDARHLDLAVRIDPAAGTVSGTVTHTVTPLGEPAAWLRLDQVGLSIDAVRIDGQPVEGVRTGTTYVDIPMPSEGHHHEVAVDYHGQPESGLHFRGPQHGHRAIEVWSQGEDEDNRFWYPGFDHPRDKFTVSTALTVPSALRALAVGEVQGSESAEPGWTTWRYALEQPIANYLVAIAVGEYERFEQGDAGDVPIELYVAKGLSTDIAQPAFAQVLPMLPWMEEQTGVDFPYPLYRQVVVQGFLYGAMENPTLVPFNTRYLTAPDDPRPYRAEEVIAHELAHQWFGNLVTTWSWSELWLNEGFATVMAHDWMAHHHGAGWAADNAWNNRASAVRSTRPMAPRAHSRVEGSLYSDQYVQGMTVLRWVRRLIGEQAYRGAVHHYLVEQRDGFAQSADLRMAFEEASGRDLGWLFDQFVHGGGHPTLSSSWSFDEEVGLTLDLKLDEGWDFPVDVVIGTADGPQRRTTWLHGDTQLVLELDAAPTYVVLDPDAVVLARLEQEQSVDAWLAALQSDDAGVVVSALHHLEDADDSAVSALDAFADSEQHILLRERAVRDLGDIGTADATAALLDRTGDDHPVLREAAVDALGQVPTAPGVVGALRRVQSRDSDSVTAASALVALAEHEPDTALRLARAGIRSSDSWMQRFSASVLGEHGDVSELSLLLGALDPRLRSSTRSTARHAAVSIARRSEDDAVYERVRTALLPMLDDTDLRLRQQAIYGLGSLPGSGPILRAYANRIAHPELIEAARDAAVRSARAGEPDERPEPEGDEADELETLKDRLRALTERLDRLEQWR